MVCTLTIAGSAGASRPFSRSSSPTVGPSPVRSIIPFSIIHASSKIFDRYGRPPSGRITSTVLSGGSSRATSIAACTASPHEPPISRPSSRATRRVVRKVSRSDTVIQRSTDERSKVSGQKSSPTPSTRYGRTLSEL